MRATGIVRRVDDLGRIVIPKEIRKQMGIKELDPVEFFVDSNTNGIIIQKCVVSLEEHLEHIDELILEYGDRNPKQQSKIHEHIEEIKQLLKEDNEE